MAGTWSEGELEEIGRDERVAVGGHSGRLVRLRRFPAVAVALGRRHLYEGFSVEEATAVITRGLVDGVRDVIIVNAAGGLDPRFVPGDVMIIDDILVSPIGPRALPGPSPGGWGVVGRTGFRGDLLARELNDQLERRCIERGIAPVRGVYAHVAGPSYETRAEIGMLRRLGCHAVGMSAAPEILAARSGGARVVGLSLVSNVVSDTLRAVLDHQDVVDQGIRGAETLRGAIEAGIEVLSGDGGVGGGGGRA